MVGDCGDGEDVKELEEVKMGNSKEKTRQRAETKRQPMDAGASRFI
jgi:hypothetical protein